MIGCKLYVRQDSKFLSRFDEICARVIRNFGKLTSFSQHFPYSVGIVAHLFEVMQIDNAILSFET